MRSSSALGASAPDRAPPFELGGLARTSPMPAEEAECFGAQKALGREGDTSCWPGSPHDAGDAAGIAKAHDIDESEHGNAFVMSKPNGTVLPAHSQPQLIIM